MANRSSQKRQTSAQAPIKSVGTPTVPGVQSSAPPVEKPAEPPLDPVSDSPDLDTDDGNADIESKYEQVDPHAAKKITVKPFSERFREVPKNDNRVRPPNGRIIEPGEPVTIEGIEKGETIIIKENTWQKFYPFGSSRPSYKLLYRANQRIPKSRMQNLDHKK